MYQITEEDVGKVVHYAAGTDQRITHKFYAVINGITPANSMPLNVSDYFNKNDSNWNTKLEPLKHQQSSEHLKKAGDWCFVNAASEITDVINNIHKNASSAAAEITRQVLTKHLKRA